MEQIMVTNLEKIDNKLVFINKKILLGNYKIIRNNTKKKLYV